MCNDNSKIYTLDELRAILIDFGQKFNIHVIYLFGSYAREEATVDSDIDIIVDSEQLHGLIAFEEARCYLEDTLGKQVDMISLRAFTAEQNLPHRRHFVENVLKDQVRIDV